MIVLCTAITYESEVKMQGPCIATLNSSGEDSVGFFAKEKRAIH